MEDRLEKVTTDMLRQKEYVEFYVGRNGEYDVLVASAIKRAQKAFGHHNSSLILVQPYSTRDDVYYEAFYDEIWYPIEAKTHPKAAITKRNQWLIDHADLLIAYVEDHRMGGAMTALKYAQKAGIEIVNLADPNE